MSNKKRKEYDKAYYEANKEKKKSAALQRYHENKEQILIQNKLYYEKNKEKLLEYGKQYNTAYYENNHIDILEKRKQYYHDNAEQINQKRKNSYQMNIEERREHSRKQYYKYFVSSLVLGMKNRAKKKHLDFDVDAEYLANLFIQQNNCCAVTKISFEFGEDGFRKSYRRPFAPSIDRIDCTKGYTKDNIRIVCVVVNIAINDFGDSVFDKMCEEYIKNKHSGT